MEIVTSIAYVFSKSKKYPHRFAGADRKFARQTTAAAARKYDKKSVFAFNVGIVSHHFDSQMAGVGADFIFDFVSHFRVVAQKDFCVFASLTEFFAFVREPCAGFFNQPGFDAEVDLFAGFGNSFSVHDVKIDGL